MGLGSLDIQAVVGESEQQLTALREIPAFMSMAYDSNEQNAIRNRNNNFFIFLGGGKFCPQRYE